ncbi:hypothetical protein [Sphingomonas panni]|uniref:hypothetical protein n=1 Tax=Sphingomonas panni TaxID=237612 RepID=UPI001F5BF2E2|nr:hypothetical protein [Sphingomonas panni]
MRRNRGRLPTDAIGARVRGTLRNGRAFGPWAADGPNGCRWTLMDHPFDIDFYEVVQ